VDEPEKKPIIGILGGIASGKSTVAGEFAKLGCKVVDADGIARELLQRKGVKNKIAGVFGEASLNAAGEIDREKLGNIVFCDADRLAALNHIMHPLVLARVDRLIERYKRQRQVKAIVLDMPLLVEVGWHKRCDRLIFVDCNRHLRAARARKTGIFNEEQLKMRENFQIPLDRKRRLADNVIENNSGVSQLARQVGDIFSYILSK
jgi:dephospho-CoA kinase